LLHRIARLAIAAPRPTVALAALVTVVAAVFGIPVAKSLSPTGFEDPTSESAVASRLLADRFGQGDQQLVVILTSPDGADSAEARTSGTAIVNDLQQSSHVASVTSAWTAPPAAGAQLVSRDGKSGLIVAGITGGERDAPNYASALSEQILREHDGVTLQAGGPAMVNAGITEQTQTDLLLMESIAIPLSFLVLVWVFGGLLAAALPLVMGGDRDRWDALAVLRRDHVHHRRVDLRAEPEHVAMGLALAIDYTLLIISRYRDELADGAAPEQALSADHGDRRPHGVVLGYDSGAVDGRDDAVPDVLPQIVGLRRRRGGGLGGAWPPSSSTPAAMVLLGEQPRTALGRASLRPSRPRQTRTGA
jgi:RND superfamily putative drug exporter